MTFCFATVASNGGLERVLLEENQEKEEPSHSKERPSNFRRCNGERNISESDVSIVGLKRRVGFISGTALIVGTMIGICGESQHTATDALSTGTTSPKAAAFSFRPKEFSNARVQWD